MNTSRTKPLLRHASVGLTLLFGLRCMPSQAGQGLSPPHPQAWWPQWQARLSLQAAPASGQAAFSSAQARSPAARSIQGGALLGDYYFARPALGQFRASGGLMLGQTGGVPLVYAPAPAPVSTAAAESAAGWASSNLSQGALSRLGLTVLGGGAAVSGWPPTDAAEPAPYLGLGYSGSLWGDRLSVSADMGLVYQRQLESGRSRTLFGNQGSSQALRELRLLPVMQLGMRYTF